MSDGVKLVALSFTDGEECDASSLQNKISAWWKDSHQSVPRATKMTLICGARWRAWSCVRCRKTPRIIPQPRETASPFVGAENAAWLHGMVGVSSCEKISTHQASTTAALRVCVCFVCLFVCLFACVNCCFSCGLQLVFQARDQSKRNI